MPLECPFNPKRDYFWWPESGESDANDFYDGLGKTWFCPFCGKSFLCAERLTIHWDEEHRPNYNNAEDTVCLSDYCDIMRCDVLISGQRKRKSQSDIRYTLGNDEQIDHKNCNVSKMAKMESQCRTIVRQCIVGLLATTLSVKDFEDIEDDLLKAICSYLHCDKFWDDSMKELLANNEAHLY
ncbi:hypothetical protein B4U79_02230 [Dinothrombium tinctorium]|uniref:C2H2-type domain-containing protein n=1 Tax=Dinothrombium tinctorium TaxID=1965070 RepID=A0A443R1I9_9ACAR|nr:hypothetical protein B4U79_02230 [Dinothrombium tinctorium]